MLVLDGAMGTQLQQAGLTADDFGGAPYEGCNERLVLTRPDVVRRIHASYLEAGADIVETNTFGGTPLVLEDFGIAHEAEVINRAAARLAREAADAHATPERPRWVAGSIGPTTKALSVTGGITFAELVEHFRIQARALHEGGVDYFLVETCQDTRNIKAALLGIEQAQVDLEPKLPVAVSATIEPMGTMLAGQTAEALAAALDHIGLLYLGLNCATGPLFMTDHIRSLAALSRTRIACVPNAGLPDEEGRYSETPEALALVLQRFGENGWLNLVGGCCGTGPAHVQALAAMAQRLQPRAPAARTTSTLSGLELLEVTEEKRPILVGERTNVIGSRKFKRLVAEGLLEEAAEIAREQVKGGAAIVDVCLSNPDRDELADTDAFLERLTRTIKAPVMIDSTDEVVIERALTHLQGKAIINSVNLEDGEERFAKVAPLARRYGAALVVGCIDEQGMATTAARKLEVALRSHELLTTRYGMRPEDLYFDPLVFPCATGDVAYVGSGPETIEGVRRIKEHLPRSKTVLGISNVSFGLPDAGREVLNSVFLYHCVQAGLDLALVNTEKLERYASIPEEERRLAEDLLHGRGADPVAAFAARFRDRKSAVRANERDLLPIDERIARNVIEGSRAGLLEDLTEKLRTQDALSIVNGPLMAGMDEVGRLFGRNELIVAEVLQSAEVMKAAVDFLEPHMEKAAIGSRGRLLLATVKGDVHDIGKNLVEIILANNGFEVIDLGIKVPPERLVAAVREHAPHAIGLSGLLVKSAQQMVSTATDLRAAGINLPLLVGGAALSRAFVERKIAPAYDGPVAYAQDAMAGLELARGILGGAPTERPRRAASPEVPTRRARPIVSTRRSREIRPLDELPTPPDLCRHVLRELPLDAIWRYVNPMMLYGRHLGLKGRLVRQIEELPAAELQRTELGRKALELRSVVDEVKAACRDGWMHARAVYRFARVEAEGNCLHLADERGEWAGTFTFPRQQRDGGLCLTDLAERSDTVGLFVVTAGEGIRARAAALKAKGAYLKSHVLQALALETAEAAAEWIHGELRAQWGFPDAPELTMRDRFRAAYRGKRYSFGYPACPDLEDQRLLFQLLKPAEIGVELTDGCMMDPEASVSALVFHHPDATYFSVEPEVDEGGRLGVAR